MLDIRVDLENHGMCLLIILELFGDEGGWEGEIANWLFDSLDLHLKLGTKDLL